MNKYTYFILVIAIAIIASTFYYTSPTQQWSRQEKLYQGQINSLSGANQNLIEDAIGKFQQIRVLSGQIQSNYNQVDENIKAQEKIQLCIKSKSMDCANADKQAMVSLIPKANASMDTDTEQDTRDNIINATPVQGTFTKVNPKVTTYYTNNPQ